VNREIVGPLAAWDLEDRRSAVLQPGMMLSECRVLRNWEAELEPYVVEFMCGGRGYSSPLFRFQPRTQALSDALETSGEQTAA
jgi:hypothetical protein